MMSVNSVTLNTRGMPEPVQLLRIAGLITVALSALVAAPTHLGFGDPHIVNPVEALFANSLPSNLISLLELAAYIAWGWAFWRVTRAEDIVAPRRSSFVLLGAQTIIAVLFATDLLYVGAVEIALLVPFRIGMVWIPCQVVAGLLTYVAYPSICAAVFPSSMLTIPRPLLLLLGALQLAAYHFFAYSLGILGATESRQRRALMHANAELRAMQQIEADAARLAERLTIARELHDSMGHHLTALSVSLQLATKVGPENASQSITEAYMVSRLLLSDVRAVVTDLRDLNAVRLAESLRTLAANLQTPTIHLDIDPAMEEALEPLPSHALFRCVQEIITNTVRHSGARNLWIRLALVNGAYELHTNDDGHGVAQVVWGNGLTGMRERVEELGGSMQLSTRAGNGFSVKIGLPRKEAA